MRSSPSSSTPRAACSSPTPATGTRFDAARRTAGAGRPDARVDVRGRDAGARRHAGAVRRSHVAGRPALRPARPRSPRCAIATPAGRWRPWCSCPTASTRRAAARPDARLPPVFTLGDGRRRGAARSRGAGGRRRRRGADRFRRRAVGDDRRARLPRRAGRGARRRERPRRPRAPRQPARRRHAR